MTRQKTLKQLFKKYPNCIINTDSDGFLCGHLVHEYYGCRIVGFSNSKLTIWVEPGTNMSKVIYLDMFVSDPDVPSIDQHIVAVDRVHTDSFKETVNGEKRAIRFECTI